MIAIRTLTTALTIAMFAAIALCMATGDFSGEGSWILDHPWGRMSLIDLYVGIALLGLALTALLVLSLLGLIFISSLVAPPKLLFGRALSALAPSLFPSIIFALLGIMTLKIR